MHYRAKKLSNDFQKLNILENRTYNNQTTKVTLNNHVNDFVNFIECEEIKQDQLVDIGAQFTNPDE